MQVTKVGCVGKTCALAKLNDSSGGKKSKRRSKEERKEMVETFVKRHQASNNGNFPSLHLTHKEVGGSYYTVREIFRELIQENRVLAPPKLPPGEENMENLDTFLENNPLGSISFDPNVHGLLPKDTKTLVNEYETRRAKVLNSKWVSQMHSHNLDNDDLINGSSHTTMENEEFVEPKHMPNACEGDNDETKEVIPSEGYIHHLSEDVVVETFPLRPVSSMVHNADEKTNEKEVLDSNLELETDNHSNALVDTNLGGKSSSPLQGSTDENIASSSEYLDSNDSSSSLQHSTFEETTADKNKSEMQPSGTVQKQTADETLNGINIDSWEASKKSVSQETTNPILSFMKTVVAAFVKFWSE
ncbi:hypothetical protein M8C21_027502 [Ambrosia artemisiifolia]|uniref:AT3G52170-like helix-turn-helix domain-containing protein n=1 Tax=Ambrosia artemisiifolia TaxID=4212 RepID=A0AAD5CXP9_AMBAR|nr:hypothetical protein M8C21_027502 [Ambrosia artemisiifolia]